MNPNREEALFALTLEQPPEKRPGFLEAVCAGDSALRQRLDALLAAHARPDELPEAQTARTDEFPESPTCSQGLGDLDPPTDPRDETVGQALGRYKLLEKLGEGGCGVVYVAEQTEPVRRRVVSFAKTPAARYSRGNRECPVRTGSTKDLQTWSSGPVLQANTSVKGIGDRMQAGHRDT